jgi:hypothetical protein
MKKYILIILCILSIKVGYAQFDFTGKLFEHTMVCSEGYIDSNKLFPFQKRQIFFTNENVKDTFLDMEKYEFDTSFSITISYSEKSGEIAYIGVFDYSRQWHFMEDLSDSTLGLRHFLVENSSFSFDIHIVNETKKIELGRLFRKNEKVINYELNKTLVLRKRAFFYISNIKIKRLW